MIAMILLLAAQAPKAGEFAAKYDRIRDQTTCTMALGKVKDWDLKVSTNWEGKERPEHLVTVTMTMSRTSRDRYRFYQAEQVAMKIGERRASREALWSGGENRDGTKDEALYLSFNVKDFADVKGADEIAFAYLDEVVELPPDVLKNLKKFIAGK